MGLTNKKEEQLRKMPYIQAKTFRSKDGKYIVHRTTITDIKPVAYYEKVMSDEESREELEAIELEPEVLSA